MDQELQLGHSKIVSVADAQQMISSLKEKGQDVIFTNGCFDILHPGHVQYLDAAKQLGDFLVLGLNSDNSIRRIKGPERPICDEAARAYMLAALSCIDAIVIFEEDTPENLIRELRPNVLVKGADWEGKKLPGSDAVDRVEFMKFLPGWSTTDIISRIRQTLESEQ